MRANYPHLATKQEWLDLAMEHTAFELKAISRGEPADPPSTPSSWF